MWDFVGDGTSKLYASAGRFFFAIPTDLNARVFSANTQIRNYNYSPTETDQDFGGRPSRLIQVGIFEGEPVESHPPPGLKASYQDEYTLGVEKALDPTFSVGIKGTYRSLGRTVEDRCDLDYTDPLAQGSTCGIFNPGSCGPIANGAIKTCNTSANTTDPQAGLCNLPGVPVGDAKRIFRGIELTARKAFSQTLWAQASYLYSTLKGNYSGAIREASGQTDPGINADYDYWQFTTNAYGNLELDRPHQFRIDAVYNAPFGLSIGGQVYVRSGVPTSRLGYYNSFYPDLLYLDQRGSNGRLPDRLRDEPLARLQLQPRSGDDHPAALHLQPAQPADGHGHRPALQHLRQLRHDQGQPVLRPGRHRARKDRPGQRRCLPRVVFGPVLGQRGLPEGDDPRFAAPLPGGSQDLLLSS